MQDQKLSIVTALESCKEMHFICRDVAIILWKKIRSFSLHKSSYFVCLRVIKGCHKL